MKDIGKIWNKITNPIPLPDRGPIAKKDKIIIGALLFVLIGFRVLYLAKNEATINILDYIIAYCFTVWGLWFFDQPPFLKKILVGLSLPLKIVFFLLLGFLNSTRELAVYLLIGTVVFLVIAFVSLYTKMEFKDSTITYLVMTISSILITYISDPIIEYSFVERTHFKEETKSLLNGNRMRSLIFTIYFIFLLTINTANFNQSNIMGLDQHLPAILQSFVTFIAFDRVYVNVKT